MQQRVMAIWKTTVGKLGALAVALLLVGGIWAYVAGGNTGSAAKLSVPTVTADPSALEFKIDQSQSQASFTIGEVLRGSPNTVVGTTNQVAGSIYVDENTPTKVSVSNIVVNVASLVTDDDLRNRALRDFILETNTSGNETATFHPTAITGLPASVSIGQTFSFEITGNLKLHGVTKSETFDATVTIVSQSEMKGQAKTTLAYSDFNVSIPNVPFVASVDKQVTLAIAFVANHR